MSVCANRPTEEPGFFTACERRVDGKVVKCACGEAVRAEVRDEQPVEVGQVRTPDSAREAAR